VGSISIEVTRIDPEGSFSYLDPPPLAGGDYGGIKNLRCGTTDLPSFLPGKRYDGICDISGWLCIPEHPMWVVTLVNSTRVRP